MFFITVILLIALPSFIYSLGYLKGKHSKLKNMLGQLMMVAFVFSMIMVVSVRHVFVFLIMWEIMSLLSYFLILFEKENAKAIEAGTIYLVMTHAGTALLIIAFFLMYKYTGSFDFLVIKQALVSLPSATKDWLFVLLFIGFGAKAGIVPFHIWLPYAHPKAPSHISCLMSGVMIKTAIYGMLRFIFFMLGINAFWWGELVLLLAVISCLVGVIYALIEHDLKTLLAYHSVENIGIILLGLGASMFFIKAGLLPLAILALSAGL
ncbi:hydrogenase 4 subunit B, partial [Candidatus Saganbacteria bacterium CG08_land_8_20_14_0_20_45_16]